MSKQTKAAPPTKCIHHCFKWMYHMLFYAGCLTFRLHGNELQLTHSSVLYMNVMRTSLICGFIGGFAMKFNDEESSRVMFGHLSPVLKFVLSFECLSSIITFLEVTLMLAHNRHAHIHLAEEFQRLDQRLVHDFPYVNWNYYKSVRKYSSFTISVIIFYFIVSLIYVINLSNCSCSIVSTLLISVTYACITAVPGGAGFLHLGQMDMLRIRYRLIHKVMAKLFAERSLYKNQQELHWRIRRLMGYYRSYTQLILKLNQVFGYVCAAGIFYDFGIITNMVFLICQKASESKAKPKEYVFIVFFMLPRMYKVLMTSCYGYIVEHEKRKCAHLIVRYEKYFPKSPEVRAALHAFLHWKMHHNYELTLGKTIRYNLNVVYMVIHGIANYVIILIQLQFQQNSITNQLKNHDMARDVEIINPRRPQNMM